MSYHNPLLGEKAPQTLNQAFLRTVAANPEREAYSIRQGDTYVGINWAEAAERVRQIAAGYNALGLQRGDRVAILSANMPAWALSDYACCFAGMPLVPLYPNLPSNQLQQIMEDCEARVILVQDRKQLEKVLRIIDNLPALEYIVMLPDEGVREGEERLLSWQDLLERGRAWNQEHPGEIDRVAASIGPEDVFTFIYTSGTTGKPKGVMLCHRNLIANLRDALTRFEPLPTDVFLSFLPLSHVFERLAQNFGMSVGGATRYARGILTVGEDLPVARPTIMVSVPRLMEKVWGNILDQAKSGPKLKYNIFKWCVRVGLATTRRKTEGRMIHPGLKLAGRIADRLLYSKIRAKFGGRLRMVVAGGAPMQDGLGEKLQAVGITVIEGYGMTETSPVIAANSPVENRFGSVGKPFPSAEVKIARDGEILTRGPHVMQGYYKMPEETAAAIKDGWMHTGDIGYLDSDGFLHITDRKKNMIVTSGGKNIAPQPIEFTLATSPYIEQVMLVGEKRNFISALIVPNYDLLRRDLNLGEGAELPSTEEIATHPEVYELIDAEIQRLSTELAQYERVRRFSILGSEFSIETGELTPSLKIKRHFVLDKYREIIEGMYLTSDNKDRVEPKASTKS